MTISSDGQTSPVEVSETNLAIHEDQSRSGMAQEVSHLRLSQARVQRFSHSAVDDHAVKHERHVQRIVGDERYDVAFSNAFTAEQVRYSIQVFTKLFVSNFFPSGPVNQARLIRKLCDRLSHIMINRLHN